MSLASTHHELDELGGGRFRHVQAMRAIGYRQNGSLLRSLHDWGDGDLGHLVTKAPLMASAAGDGKYRIYPTREFDRYIELSQPMVKPAASWVVAGFGNPVRSGNTVTFTQAQGRATLALTMGGHFLKLDIELLGGYVPPSSQFAWPITLVGLTRSGNTLLADGVPVCSFRAPVVYDADNPLDVRPIAFQFGAIGGQTGVLFTLPSLVGMSRPVVDPTLSLQPDATAGKDALIEGPPSNNNNHGIDVSLWTGNWSGQAYLYRSLIQFDLSALPANAVISSAVLSLYFALKFNCVNNPTLGVYRLKQSWVEGTANGTANGSGATWDTYDGSDAWSGGSGGFGASDCEQAYIGSRVQNRDDAADTEETWTLTAATKGDLDLGQGWLIKSVAENGDLVRYRSSDYATAAYRPKLVIVYTLPASTGSLISVLRHRG